MHGDSPGRSSLVYPVLLLPPRASWIERQRLPDSQMDRFHIIAGLGYCKSTACARRKLRRRSMPTTTSRSRSLSFFAAAEAALDVALEAAPGAGCRSSRQPPLAKMLEVSIATALPPTCKLTSTMRRYPISGALSSGRSEPSRPPPESMRDLAEGLASSTRPVAVAPRGTSVRPSSTTASSTVAAKLSPVCADALDNAVCRRTRIGVPSGNFVVDGISGGRAKFPAARAWRSNGRFCELAEFGPSAGGRLQPHRASISTTITTRLRWQGMLTQSEYQLPVSAQPR